MHLELVPLYTEAYHAVTTGAKIINLNLQDPRDKEIYQGTQKYW